MEKRHPPSTCALDSSRVPEYRVIVSARDATTTTYVAHAFFQPVPSDCYAGTCNSVDGSCVCTRSGTFQLQCPLSLKYTLPHGIRLGMCVQHTFGGPNCNVRSCHHCLLHSLGLERAQTSTLMDVQVYGLVDGSQMWQVFPQPETMPSRKTCLRSSLACAFAHRPSSWASQAHRVPVPVAGPDHRHDAQSQTPVLETGSRRAQKGVPVRSAGHAQEHQSRSDGCS